MDLTKALTIDGWMSQPELEWLAEQASKYRAVVEIGSWMGRTTRALADNANGLVVAIDTWEGSAENAEFLKDKPKDFLFDKFKENLADHIATHKVSPMRMKSIKAAMQFSALGMKFGMVFIDAGHDYQNVSADILAWRPLVMSGGLLCGHDYDWGYPGVVYAVRELIAMIPNQAANGSSIWYQVQGEDHHAADQSTK